jgi:hypothetical protein
MHGLHFHLAAGDTKIRAKARRQGPEVLRRKTDNFGRRNTAEPAFF